MSPDIEWHVGEESEHQTFINTPTPRRPRWRVWAVLLMVVLGAGLGILYRLIPEPPAPTPAPSPTEPPLSPLAPLEETITQEARALSTGDVQGYMALQDPTDQSWRTNQLSTLSRWDPLPSPYPYPLYTIVESGTLGMGRMWADVIQYRVGQYFRETRFYRPWNDHWARIKPILDPSFWGAAETVPATHFDLTFHEKDRDHVIPLLVQLERRFTQACQTFGCDPDLTRRMFHISFEPGIDKPSSDASATGQYTVTLPSPRLTGLYYQGPNASILGQNEQIDAYFEQYMFFEVLYQASGGLAHWGTDPDGIMYIYPIGIWELARQGRVPSDTLPFQPQMLNGQDLLPLDSLWSWSDSGSLGMEGLISAESSALIKFIDETYGPETVIRFFKALRDAQSLSDAIKVTGVPYGEFEKKWQDWLKQYRGVKS